MNFPMTHARAIALMVLVALLWSTAGVVTRHLEQARSFEVTFWRSLFAAVAMLLALLALRGRSLARDISQGGIWLWLSGLCWAVMFTNFMLAITMTSVARVLVTLSIAPLLTALFARIFLHHRLPTRTWVAIAVAGLGIGWMFGRLAFSGSGSMMGSLVALGVPIAGAANWTLLQYVNQRHVKEPGVNLPDMLPAVLVGALISCAVTLPMAWPLAATAPDLALLGLLGFFQLALPCLMAVWLARILSGPEISLIALLEVIFGVLLAWWGAGEVPGPAALQGGALVVGALLVNEGLALRGRRNAASAAQLLA